MNDVSEVRMRIQLARCRIASEMEALSAEIGPEWVLDLRVLRDDTHTIDGRRFVYRVSIDATMESENW